MRRVLALLAMLAALTPAAGCGRGPSPGPGGTVTRLSIATGGTGGVYYVLGGGLARLLSRELPGVEATAEVTSASVENMHLLHQRSADVAFCLADTAYDAANGRDRFSERLPVRTLAVLYDNMTHLVVAAESPIRSVPHLRGRRVSAGSPNSGTELIAERTLRVAGLDPGRDVTRERLGASESASALKDGKIDAFFWSGGVPTAAVLELASTPGLRIRLVGLEDTVPRLVQAYGPLYAVATVPAEAYPGVPETRVSSVANLLMVHEDMPEELAYGIVRTLFEKKDELVAVHPEARRLDLTRAATGSPVSYHRGAVRFYKEKGVWPAR